jgi:ATP-binding cassette subfamily B protein
MSVAEAQATGLVSALTDWGGLASFYHPDLKEAVSFIPVKIGKRSKIVSKNKAREVFRTYFKNPKPYAREQVVEKAIHKFGIERSKLIIALVAVLINAGANVATPFITALAIDSYISTKNLDGLVWVLLALLGLYFVTLINGYFQTRLVGQISQRVLFKLRGNIFDHMQGLPVAFFQANRAGDIIARVNNDTEKLNNFLSQGIFAFVASFFSFVGIGVFIFFLNWQLALVVWTGVIFVIIFSQLVSKQVQIRNKQSLTTNGEMTGFLDENLNNFKALVAFNKGQYFRETFEVLNQDNFSKSIWAQFLNGVFNPVYSFAGNFVQILILGFGIYFLSQSFLTIGLLIGFIGYTQKFYEPLRTLGNIWGNLQEALAAWVRIQKLLQIK